MVLFFQKTHLLVLEVAGFVRFFVGKKGRSEIKCQVLFLTIIESM